MRKYASHYFGFIVLLLALYTLFTPFTTTRQALAQSSTSRCFYFSNLAQTSITEAPSCPPTDSAIYNDTAGVRINTPQPGACYLFVPNLYQGNTSITSEPFIQVDCTSRTYCPIGQEPRYANGTSGQVSCVDLSLSTEAGAGAEGTSAEGEDSTESCNKDGGDFSFFLCPILIAANEGVEILDGKINNSLQVKDTYYRDQSVRNAWGRFRNIAYILLIPVILLMVIGTALGFSFVDAYTVKRAMPRLLVAVIFMALSYNIAIIMIEATNVVGRGVGGLVAAPFGGTDALRLNAIFSPGLGGVPGAADAVAIPVGILGGVGIFFAGGLSLGILASYLGGFVLVLIIAFALLTVREFLIIALVILSPIAIISWIFPGNDKLWKLWWSTFTKLLMLYPLIMMLLMSGRGFALITSNIDSEGALDSVFLVLIKLAAYFGPFFFIPAAFKFAGGAFANLAGIVNDRGKGLFDRNRQFRANKRKQLNERARTGNRFKGNNAISRRMSRAAQTGTIVAGGKLSRSSISAERSVRNIEQNAKAKENTHVKAVLGNDDVLNAAMAGDGTEESARMHLRSLGQSDSEIEQNIAMLKAAKKAVGTETFNMVAAIANAGTGTGYGSGPAEMLMAINRAAGSDRSLAATMLAEARGNADRSGRGDLSGAGFATSARQMQRLYENGVQDINSDIAIDVNREMTDNALIAKSAGVFAGGRNNALVNMLPAMQRRLASSTARLEAAQTDLTNATISGDSVAIAVAQSNFSRAHHSHKQTLAATAAFQDVAAQISPENAETIGQQLLGQHAGPIIAADGTNIVLRDASGNVLSNNTTYLDQIEHFRGDREFNQYRREYASQQGQAAAASAAARSFSPSAVPPVVPPTTPFIPGPGP